MKNLKVSKKFIACLLAGAIAIGGASFVLSNKPATSTVENRYGHNDFSIVRCLDVDAFNIDDNDFAVLDVGDHDSVGVHFQDTKMTYCNEHDISLGIIVSSSANDEVSIYDDVEYVKGIVRDYDVDFPVYLNIDEIMTNDDLNVEMKTKIIKDFLEKCSSNNIYVGIYGTDINLCRVKKYCNITEYDAFLVMDKEEISYDGTYNVCKNLDGEIRANYDLAYTVNNKKLNSSDRFVNDGTYIIEADDELTDVALKFGLSVNELLEFNNLSKDDVVVGTSIRVPCLIDNSYSSSEDRYEVLDEPIRGCDISYAQGKNINWDEMSENFEYVILKCSQGLNLDNCFEDNIKNCNIYDIPVGVYCYNGYSNNNCDDIADFTAKQNKQADFVLSNLKNKNIVYPVYFDIEAPNGTDIRDYVTKEQVNVMLDIWSEKMSDSGYLPGLYFNQSGYRYIQSCVDYPLSDKFQVWIAGGDQYGMYDIDFKDVEPSSVLYKEEYGVTMAQSTDGAINAGAGNSNGHLDINYSLIDYSNPQTSNEVTGYNYDIKDFNRMDLELIGLATLSTLALAGGTVLGVKTIKKAKSKEKTKTK